MRERRMNGNTICFNGHTCPTAEYVNDPTQLPSHNVALEAGVAIASNQQEEVSLNAGSELEDELQQHVEPSHELLFGNFTPGQVPELRQDIELVALEGALQDLAYLKEDMLRTGGMQQSFAMEAQRLLPRFDGGVPLGYYTKEPSATRYKVALEEIHRGFWALLAAAVAAVIAALYKLISWWRGSEGSSHGAAERRAAEAEKNQEILKGAEERVNTLKEALASGDASVMRSGHADRAITMDSLVKELWDNPARYERALAFLKLPHPINRDIVERGPYSQAFSQLSAHLGGIANVLRLKLGELDKVSHLDKHSFLEQDTVINKHMLEIIATPVKVGFGGTSLTLAEAADKLRGIRQDVEEHADADTPLSLDRLIHSVVAAYHQSEVVEYFKAQAEIGQIFEEMNQAANRLKKTVGNLASDGSVGHNSQAVGEILRDVVFKVAEEIQTYQAMFVEMNRYGMYLERLANQALGFTREVELQLLAQDRRGTIKMPEEWKRQASDYQSTRIHAIFHSASPNT